jgi:hypothetical protein
MGQQETSESRVLDKMRRHENFAFISTSKTIHIVKSPTLQTKQGHSDQKASVFVSNQKS